MNKVIISDDIKQNFIPKMLNLDQPSPTKNKHYIASNSNQRSSESVSSAANK